MAATKPKAGQVATRPTTRETAVEKFTELVTMIPEGGDDDGSGIILDILNATDWADLNREAELPDARDMAGRDLVFTDATRHVSTIDGGLPFYLIVNAVDKETGEAVRFNTSAGSIITKLAKLWQLGCWPFRGVISATTKPTRAGFYPLDLAITEVNVA